ncbi:hypothetical protein V6N11_066900 [Hibiscus sabdariffa]|uniref:Uncharacterized protein n=1 Tax=Hibiscus sabdariffa TaxID=183260 RepID=A0ABR2SQ51_9ROSI
MFAQYQQQQSMQKQEIVVENDEEDRVNVVVDGQNSDGFNMFDSIRVDDQFSQYLNGVGSSSSMYVHNVFDSIPVKVESDAASNGIPSRDETFCSDSEGNAKRENQIHGFNSGGSKSQTSDKPVLKERAGGSVQHQLMHDLNGAASLFNFTNGKGIDK